MDNQTTGAFGEQLARTYLENKGFRFITANWWCKAGEIDLVMQAGETIVFVEVRLRQPTTYGAGLDTVARDKQRKLIRAAKMYQQREHAWGEARFDVVSIIQHADQGPTIEHVEWAFMAD